jgi:hypothetical protein
MVIMSNISDYLLTSPAAGIKIVIHSQDVYPFPNVDGYDGGVGKELRIDVSPVCV